MGRFLPVPPIMPLIDEWCLSSDGAGLGCVGGHK